MSPEELLPLLPDLFAVARRASCGIPWTADAEHRCPFVVADMGGVSVCLTDQPLTDDRDVDLAPSAEVLAQHVATFDPPTVLGILEALVEQDRRIEMLAAENCALRAAHPFEGPRQPELLREAV